MDDYKAAKESFVSGLTGSTVTHINLISSVALASIALYSAIQTRVFRTRAIPFFISWIVLLLPLLLSMTLFANKPGLLSCLSLVPTAFLWFTTPAPEGSFIPLPASDRSPVPPSVTPMYTQSQGYSVEVKERPRLPLLPAITTYRAHMMLMTMLGILAVDFTIFPRALAKCESYGVSLMDLGVGSFVFSNGVVSAIPLLKNPSHLSSPLLPKLSAVVRKTIPIIALGVIRVILVKGTDYPEHETEYGVHWNFFISLALLPILQVLLHPLIRVMPASVLGIGVGILQQLALSVFGLKEYVRTAPRLNLISANKEGFTSLTGYLAIHLLGLSIGTLILPPSPSFFRRLLTGRVTVAQLGTARQNDKGAIELASYAMVWWALLGLGSLVSIDEGVSRQTANLPYVLWISAFNTSSIFGYLVLDMLFFPAPPTSRKSMPTENSPTSATARAPPLLEAINKNALPLFLFANVVTGLVNLSMQTIYASASVSMAVLSVYALVLCSVAWRLRDTRVWRL
ncbi:GPI-anchored wall transfer protein [Favolaschia claudopus]|uniref:GPI-anchored wall transfer protein n=1 Tax=Favolaschia claudopus TaxID=2862362 RepID=A0AAW0BXH6_9AGAR